MDKQIGLLHRIRESIDYAIVNITFLGMESKIAEENTKDLCDALRKAKQIAYNMKEPDESKDKGSFKV